MIGLAVDWVASLNLVAGEDTAPKATPIHKHPTARRWKTMFVRGHEELEGVLSRGVEQG